METLGLDPRHLEELAQKQEQASTAFGIAGNAPGEIAKNVWITHGVMCGHANNALGSTEQARKKATDGVISAAAGLAAKLRAARQSYEDVDQKSGGDLDRQLLDR